MRRLSYAPTIGAGAGMAWRNVGATVPERDDLPPDEVEDLSIRLGRATQSPGHADELAARCCTAAAVRPFGPMAGPGNNLVQVFAT